MKSILILFLILNSEIFLVARFNDVNISDSAREPEFMPNRSDHTTKIKIDQLLNSSILPKIHLKLSEEVYAVGDIEEYWTRDISKKTSNLMEYFVSTEFQAVAISEYAYIFVASSELLNQSKIDFATWKSIGISFDEIYEQEVLFFGHPTDVDQNGKIIILFLDIQGSNSIAGYYSPINLFNNDDEPGTCILSNGKCFYSNHADIIYIDITTPNNYNATIAHEFQHLIQFAVDHKENIWLDEALSVYAEFYTGYNNTIDSLVNNSHGFGNDTSLTSLTYWQGLTSNYGMGYLFLLYLSDRFGTSIVQDISNNAENRSLESINKAIKKFDHELGLEEIFQDWAIALAINNPLQPRYSFQNWTEMVNIPTQWSIINNSVNLTRQHIAHWSVDFINILASEEGNYWLTLLHESTLWQETSDNIVFGNFKPRKIRWYLLQQDPESNQWDILNLSSRLSNQITLSPNKTSYLAVISQTGTTSGKIITSKQATEKTIYNAFLQRAITDLPTITVEIQEIQEIEEYAFKTPMPRLNNDNFWVNPENAQLSMFFEIINTNTGENYFKSSNIKWNSKESVFEFKINATDLPIGDIYAKFTFKLENDIIQIFSSPFVKEFEFIPRSDIKSFDIEFFLYFVLFIVGTTLLYVLIKKFIKPRRNKQTHVQYNQIYQKNYPTTFKSNQESDQE